MHLSIDYLHMSTRNRILRGQEVAFDSHGIVNAHFRRLAAEAVAAAGNSTGNTSNTSNSSLPTDSVAPTVDGDDGDDGAEQSSCSGEAQERCTDVPAAWASVAGCLGGQTECVAGMNGLAPFYGGMCALCGASVSAVAAKALQVGCPI
eukprot:5053423-Prymnesium_polylepis.1